MTIQTMIAQRLELSRARYQAALRAAQQCTQADDIATLAVRAKAAYAVQQELEDLQFEVNGGES